ncbi:MAG: hypothetical protein QOI82_1384 [Actinomycetota bacterium]|jgi:hypothetical protein|nr:hypothetical protein [Actinomycetota bacterium]
MPIVDAEAVRTWGSANESDLIIAQILAVDAWFAACGWASDPPRADSREDQTERRRQRLVLETIRAAIQDRTKKALELEHGPQSVNVVPRLVVAHRNAWFVEKLSAELADYGVKMVSRLVNGAEAVGVTIAEQPDLLVIEDTLALMTGREVLAEAMRYAPRTLVAVQVQEQARIATLAEAGAATAFSRAVPPVDVAGDLIALVEAHRNHAATAGPADPQAPAPRTAPTPG